MFVCQCPLGASDTATWSSCMMHLSCASIMMWDGCQPCKRCSYVAPIPFCEAALWGNTLQAKFTQVGPFNIAISCLAWHKVNCVLYFPMFNTGLLWLNSHWAAQSYLLLDRQARGPVPYPVQVLSSLWVDLKQGGNFPLFFIGESHCNPNGATWICAASRGDVNPSSLGLAQVVQEQPQPQGQDLVQVIDQGLNSCSLPAWPINASSPIPTCLLHTPNSLARWAWLAQIHHKF